MIEIDFFRPKITCFDQGSRKYKTEQKCTKHKRHKSSSKWYRYTKPQNLLCFVFPQAQRFLIIFTQNTTAKNTKHQICHSVLLQNPQNTKPCLCFVQTQEWTLLCFVSFVFVLTRALTRTRRWAPAGTTIFNRKLKFDIFRLEMTWNSVWIL